MPKTPFEKLQLERRQLRRSFTKTFNEASSLFKRDRLLNEEITFLKTAAAALQEQLKECQNLDKEIRIVALDEIEDEDESDAFFDEVTEVTNNNRGKISKLAFCISEFEKKNASTLVSQSPTSQSTLTLRSKLPDLQLPTFDGKITDWHGFWERFQTQVGSLSDLPASSKFTYLIGQLRGEALKTVQGIIPSGDNYAILEETLKENFGHPRRIVRAHVNNILKMTKPTQSAISLRQFYNAVMGDIRSLEALKINVSACAPFIIPILEDKLPGKVRSAIGDSGQGVNFLLKQFTDSFRDYIAREEQTQSGFPQATLPPPSRYESYEHNVSSTSTLSTTINTRCQLCKGPHATSHCTIPASEKSATVIQQSLCLNCLNTGHRVSNCNARGRCAKCKGKHHTSIHGIRIHSTNTTFQRNAQTQNQPPSRANTHAAIITNESSTASSAPENVSTANSTSQPITTNCAPLLNIDINDCLDDDPPYPSLHINDKSSYVNRTAKLKPPQSTNAPSEAANQQIILKTAKAVAIANDKKSNANIFFDEGSQRSYVRAEFANQLGLNPESYELLSVSGFGGTITKRNYGVSTLGLETTSGVELIRVLFSDEIVKPINQSGCYNLKNDSRFKKLEFANDFSDEHFQVDILIGADAAYRFLGSIDNQFQEPFIQKSKFGLVISGPFPKPIPELGNPALSEEITSIHTNAAKSINEVDVNSDKSFASPLSFENLVDNAELSVQFEKILQHQSLNYDNDKQKTNAFIHDYQQRVEFRDGQYFAPLPWKDEHPPLPSNLSLCKNRLTQVTTRLNKLGLMDQYCKVMDEHLAKGYIEELSNLNQPWPEEGCHYLPHFFVLKDSETTPLRIVFAANSGKVSLNDCLYTGPCLLNNLVELLHRFRFPQYAFVADIQRAFLHVKLREADRPFVRFLWYKDNDPTKDICVYTYTTIVFGHTSSPMSLGAVLLHHLEQFRTPVAVDISEKLYVDNLLSGVDNEADTISYFHEARHLMQQGNFVLRQWCSNSKLLCDLAREHSTSTKSFIVSILGLSWNTRNDDISFPALTFASASTTLTKRKVLSMTSKLYDPLGMLSPVTLIAHLYIAALWDEKFGWDQPLPPSQVAKWQKIQNDLQAASEVHFPRWINFAKAQPVALHVFTDASKSALGVTAYLTQGASSFLLGSKSKLVARNKINLTIPQLELSAMFLGSQYCDTLLNILTKDFQSVSVHLWTDSEIALFWLTSKRKLKQFVQNKVDAINSKFPSSFWGHTSTTDNPADLASRGCSTVSLTISALWQHGPKWLCDPPSWPPWPKPSTSSTVVLSAVTDQHVYTQEFSIGNVIDVNRFNSYSRLLATSVYVYRFCHRTGTTGPPTTSEIEAIERAWLKSEQLRCYPQVVSYLSSHDSHDKKIAPPILILSDNAQTFKRAEQDLQTLLAHFDSPTIKNALAQKRIRFLYIPARSPHWGGVYERLIGLTKSVLKKVLGRSLISLSELYTLIKEVQAILNDRPLTTISSDINDLQPLTPNHLLFGFNVTSLPHPPLDSVDYDPNFGNSSEISRAQHHRTTLYHHFLQRFKTEYLSLLRETHAHHNNKTHPSRNVLQEGDVVLVADTDSPRHRWPLGVVIKLLYGSDHLCRAACIRTANGHTTRSVIKLYPLELNVGKPHKEPNVSEGHAEHSTATTRPKRTAAAAARDKIFAQLIDQSHD
eukprot:gene1767-biopygen1613